MPPRAAESLVRKLERRLGVGSGGHLRYSGESVVFQILGQLSEKAVVIFDVGANVGNYAKMAIMHIPDKIDYVIHCFEPSPVAFQNLCKQFADDHKVITNQFAMGASQGPALLYTDSELSLLASLTKRNLDHYQIQHDQIVHKVNVTTLDRYATENNITSIDLLKIDVEGHEMDVMNGASQFIDNGLVKLIQFEFGGCNIDTRVFFRDIYNFLVNKGYYIYRILPRNRLLAISNYREWHERFETTNYLAVRNDIDVRKTKIVIA